MMALYPESVNAMDLDQISVHQIWRGVQYSSFTDLIYYQNQFFCVFREGESHASPDGTIRVLRSVAGENWEPVAVLSCPGLDLRDAHLSEMPDGRLMMTGGAAHYKPNESGRLTACDFQTFTAFSDNGIDWSQPRTVTDPGLWLWRLTWFRGTAYGIAYRPEESIRLLATQDGLRYDSIGSALLDTMAPNEATIRFENDGRAYCLLRREGERTADGRYTRVSALLGKSSPPYQEWQWQDTGLYLGGPNFIKIGNGAWVAGGRTRIGPARMTLLHLDVKSGVMKVLKHLPSGGDCSYPGMVWHNDMLWVSYYSTHEGQSAIYLAKLRPSSEARPATNKVCRVHDRPLPDFGIMLNDDGDFSYTDRDLAQSEKNLRQMVRSLEGTPVRTFVYNVATGSDIMLYPTKVGSVYGWRQTAGDTKPPWDKRMPIFRAAAEAKVDAVRIAAEEAKTMGMYFIPSFRMNDAHFINDATNNPLTGKFWMDQHASFELGSSPVTFTDYKYLLDYSHVEVRDHRLAVINEVIDRYSDIMDGLQLDFMRNPILFPPGTAGERAHFMTEFITAVRTKLDEAGQKEGRFLSLHVRVPPSLRNCRWAGLDVEKWLRERLVDVIIPSPAMTLAHDMPIDDFVALAQPVGAKVYPAILERNQFAWSFTSEPKASNYTSSVGYGVTSSLIRGAAATYLKMGASGFEMYNFNLPPSDLDREIIHALSDPWDGDRIYAVTPAYWNDYEDAGEYRKQIPADLHAGLATRVTMLTGDVLSTGTAEELALRLGIRGVTASSTDHLIVTLNGAAVYDGPVSKAALPVTGGTGSKGLKLHPKPAQIYVQWPITNSATIHQGRNEISVTLELSDQRAIAQLVEVQFAVFDSKVVK